MKSNFAYILLLLLLVSMSDVLLAQEKAKDKDGIGNENVIIVVDYEAIITDAQKFNDYPSITDSLKTIVNLKYDFLNKKKDIKVKVMPIQAARIGGAGPVAKLYNGFVQLAGGNHASVFLDASYASVRDKNYSVGSKLHHFSSNGKDFNQFSNSNVEVFGKKFINKKHTLSGGLAYSMDGYDYYKSRNFEMLGLDVDLNQRYNQFGGNVGFKTFHEDSAKLNLGVNIEYINFSSLLTNNLNKSLENIIDFDAYMVTPVTSSATGKVSIGLKSYGYKSEGDTSVNTIVNVDAVAVLTHDNMRMELGGRFFVVSHQGDAANIKVYPKVNFSYNIVDNIFIPYVGIAGSVKRAGYKGSVDNNPFVSPNLDLRNSEELFGYIGFKGTLSSSISYDVQGSWKKTNTRALFVQDTTDNAFNYFNLVYDTVTTLSAKLELGYEISNKLKMSQKTIYNSYQMDNLKAAWHLPVWDVSLMLEYKLKDKFKALIEVYMLDGLIGRDFDLGQEIPLEMDAFADFNLGVEYNYSSRLSAFLRLNNLSSKKYNRWYGYPRFGFNVLGGFSFSF
ncbi:MAG: TonB-dependent receptor [Flavobacteriales bacterium]|nr:TonB-dependent receptor [Flavobacteriales bacterium]